jgi:hypothetical protein
MNNVDIGENIRKYRNLKGMTQEALAEASELSVKYISMIESKKNQNISINNLQKIANALDINITFLVSNSKDSSSIVNRPYTNLLFDKLSKMSVNEAEIISKNVLNTIRTYHDLFNKSNN